VKRPVKPETEIRALKGQVRYLRKTGEQMRAQLREEIRRGAEDRDRATRAEQEAADWRRRFDELLSKCRLDPAAVPGVDR
jgi:hypothetical protein